MASRFLSVKCFKRIDKDGSILQFDRSVLLSLLIIAALGAAFLVFVTLKAPALVTGGTGTAVAAFLFKRTKRLLKSG